MYIQERGSGRLRPVTEMAEQAATVAGGLEELDGAALPLPPSKTTVPLLDRLRGAEQLPQEKHHFSVLHYPLQRITDHQLSSHYYILAMIECVSEGESIYVHMIPTIFVLCSYIYTHFEDDNGKPGSCG